MKDQLDFDFTSPQDNDGISPWRAEREREIGILCAKMGMPINYEAEVTLAQGPVLRGVVRIAEETLWIEGRRHAIHLRIGDTPFTICQVESAVRLTH